MSGFIGTMFVPSASRTSHLSPPFPAAPIPQPLQPVFTFAHSQSCMNFRMDKLEGVPPDNKRNSWTEVGHGDVGALPAPAPSRPQVVYKSPLQRIGEALRTQQAGVTSSISAQDMPENAHSPRLVGAASSASDTCLSEQSGEQSSAHGIPNYSYKLVPGGLGSPSRLNLPDIVRSSSGRGLEDRGSNGTVVGLAITGLTAQHRGYFGNASLLSSLSSNPRTQRTPFKPSKGRGTSSWQLKQYAEATLGSGSLRKAVKLPEGEDKDEWLAVNVVDFYNQINLLYGSITEFCSPQSCPEMKATDEFEYLWQDSENFKKPTKMSAPGYIEHLMAWVQSNVDNEQMFPSRIGVPFPKSFASLIRNMFKRLYRVYAHIYCHHYPVIIELGLEPHLNTSFKHYVLFIDEHGLASGSKDFWGPLGDLVESMLKSD